MATASTEIEPLVTDVRPLEKLRHQFIKEARAHEPLMLHSTVAVIAHRLGIS